MPCRDQFPNEAVSTAANSELGAAGSIYSVNLETFSHVFPRDLGVFITLALSRAGANAGYDWSKTI
jgi:hypothetical protein